MPLKIKLSRNNTCRELSSRILDNYTHNYSDRQERDQEVERMFQSAGIPLVRFSDYKSLNKEMIANRFIDARKIFDPSHVDSIF